MHFRILDTDAIEFLCSPHFSDILGFQKSFHLNSIHLASNFFSNHSDLIFILLNLSFLQHLLIYFFTSYFWCVISRFRSRGGRMITPLNWISTQSKSHCLGHLVPILCPCHLGHLITRGIVFPSFWHLCHLLHLLIIWSHLITFLIWVCWTGIGTV